jgi:outer membrane lipoprotein SlyB
MDNTDIVGDTGVEERRAGLLYPLLVIAAIGVILFSIAGMATMLGWLPDARSRAPAPVTTVPAHSIAPVRRPVPAGCADCGVIESIHAIEAKGQGSGVGAVAGGVVGGLLGSQIAKGTGRAAATAVGAGAGAYAGHEIEKNARNSVSYEIRVRMNDGTYRTIYEDAQPAWTAGQKVRVTERGTIAGG